MHFQLFFNGVKLVYSRGAEIGVQATGTPANDRVPSDILFATTPTSGATAPQQRLRINSQGSVIINGTTSFGDPVKLQVRGASSSISDGAQIFDVASTAASNGGTRLAFGVNEDTYTWVRSYESAVGGIDMVFATNTERLRIHSSGLVEANSSFSDTYTSTTSINPHLRA